MSVAKIRYLLLPIVVLLGSGTGLAQGDGPRISTSRGPEGGVVVLWPRVIPSATAARVSEQARSLQRTLRQIVARARPGVAIELRPEPQRACPQAGCLAIAVSLVLVHREDGCAAAVTVSPPGRVPGRLLAWSHGVQVRSASVPFRSPPESQLSVRDYRRCDSIVSELSQNTEAIEAAIRAVP